MNSNIMIGEAKKKLVMWALLLASLNSMQAQSGDSFVRGFSSPDTLLTNDSLLIYMYVPAAINPGDSSKLLVGIHGLGDPNDAETIRNYLSELADNLNVIVACPVPYLQDQPRSRLVVDIAIDSILTWYSIDQEHIYMAGYSAGSDVVAQYNLDNPKRDVKGLIWYAPGFFYQPNLSSLTSFPLTCLCVGDQDFVSTALNQVDAIQDSFSNSDFSWYFNEIPGVDHTMNFTGFTNEMLECMRYFDNPVLTSSADLKPFGSDEVMLEWVKGIIHINFGSTKIKNAKLRLIDTQGRLIQENRLSASSAQQLKIQVPTAGMYIVQLLDEKAYPIAESKRVFVY